jgi:hypothetical protein
MDADRIDLDLNNLSITTGDGALTHHALPSFVVTKCRRSEAELKVLATASTIRKAYLKYSHTVNKRFVKMVC